jgi:hypothetical protein
MNRSNPENPEMPFLFNEGAGFARLLEVDMLNPLPSFEKGVWVDMASFEK